jgi:hypothetical protein
MLLAFLLPPAQETLGARVRMMGEVSERRALSVHCKARLLICCGCGYACARYPGVFGWSREECLCLRPCGARPGIHVRLPVLNLCLPLCSPLDAEAQCAVLNAAGLFVSTAPPGVLYKSHSLKNDLRSPALDGLLIWKELHNMRR